MFKFATYKFGPSVTGGWWWQVTKEVGPAQLVVARSGHGYISEEYAIEAYKEFVKWAAGSDSSTPPPAGS